MPFKPTLKPIPDPDPMAKIFFSYSHKDEALRDELETHLAMLRNEGLIESWHDRRILAGDQFDQSIDIELENANIILLLVSPDFLASSYCYDIEMKRAMERHDADEARVIPVILRPCEGWTRAPFGKLLAAPRDGKPVTKWPDRDEAFGDVARQIRDALPTPQDSISTSPPQAPQQQTISSPRSSNLRLKKEFSEADQDRFLDEAFEYMARFFEGSLNELEQRNPEIETRFKRIDSQTFTATIYRNGNVASQCCIRCGGRRSFGNGITYSSDIDSRGNSFNESLSIEVGEQSLSLRPMGMGYIHHGDHQQANLTAEGASEYYWKMLIDPLQS